MNLYLMQHGEARPKEEDPQRSLSDKGRADVKKVAAFAAGQANIIVTSIMHSGKTRAEQTAKLLAEHLKPTSGIAVAEGLEPMAEPSIWAARLGDITDDIMLVGHLPHLSKLASNLLCGDENKTVIAFHNAGIVSLSRDESGSWAVGWMVTPDVVAA